MIALPVLLLLVELRCIQQRHRLLAPPGLLDTEAREVNRKAMPVIASRTPPGRPRTPSPPHRIHRHHIEPHRIDLRSASGNVRRYARASPRTIARLSSSTADSAGVSIPRRARLHLDKAQPVAVPPDQVDIPTHLRAGPSLRHHHIASPPQLKERRPLAAQPRGQVRSRRAPAPHPRPQALHPPSPHSCAPIHSLSILPAAAMHAIIPPPHLRDKLNSSLEFHIAPAPHPCDT
jgi:hypothetical protein